MMGMEVREGRGEEDGAERDGEGKGEAVGGWDHWDESGSWIPTVFNLNGIIFFQELLTSKFQWKIRLGVGLVLGTFVGGILLVLSRLSPSS